MGCRAAQPGCAGSGWSEHRANGRHAGKRSCFSGRTATKPQGTHLPHSSSAAGVPPQTKWQTTPAGAAPQATRSTRLERTRQRKPIPLLCPNGLADAVNSADEETLARAGCGKSARPVRRGAKWSRGTDICGQFNPPLSTSPTLLKKDFNRRQQRERSVTVVEVTHSTVTLLARLRGLSTSQPRATAMW